MLATNLNTSLEFFLFFFFLECWLVCSQKADLFWNAIFSFQNLEIQNSEPRDLGCFFFAGVGGGRHP